jgi:Protein of unknown function (DUF2480)
MEEIINRVSQSTLVSIDLEEMYPKGERVLYDLKDNLFQGLILKEKDFREFIKNHDWASYQDKFVAITCTADAVVPTWAYMLLAIHLEPFAKDIVFGDLEVLEQVLFQKMLSKLNPTDYLNQKVVVKGCSKLPVPTFAYVELTRILRPVVASLMFGEPCSTVPLYKKSKTIVQNN